MTNKLKAASASISINIALAGSKIVLAVFTGSIGLVAESVHSLFDLLASTLAYLGIKKAEQPDDHNHHYGHEKFENLSSLLQALLITGTGMVVIWEAYQKFLHPTVIANSEWGIVLMIISIPVTYFTAKYLAKIARQEGGSQALEADSAHFTSDVLGSVAVLIGLVMAKLGMAFGDPLAAVVVGVIMLVISVQLAIRSFLVFMDFSPEPEKIKVIEKVLNQARKQHKISHWHKLRARLTGNKILLEMHIQVPRKLDIVEAHQISSDIKRKIKTKLPEVKDATIHIEPD